MVNKGKGRLFRRKDNKYLIYLPLDLATDSMFPFQTQSSIPVKISFNPNDTERKLLIQPLEEN